jgi:signal transduction histidine kinase
MADPSHLGRRARPWGFALVWACVFAGLYVVHLSNFLLFHSLAELFSITIASAVFLVAWNSRRRLDGNFLVVVGVAYACVGFLDALHMLAYAGMGVFPGRGANLPTQLWLAARYVEAASLLVASAFVGDAALNERLSFTHRFRDTALLVVGYLSLTGLLVAAVFLGVFPDAFVEETGLTAFKIYSEYLIVALLLAALFRLYRTRAAFEDRLFRYLAVGIVSTILAELFFTVYVSVYGVSNMFGHLMKIVSFYFIYLAVVKTGIATPQKVLFRQLQDERDALAERETQLEAKNARLDRFAGIVSHDLRNPLNVANGNVELERGERESERLETAAAALERMDALIADLLALAREGNAITDTERVSLSDLAAESWDSVETADARLVAEDDVRVTADPARLRQLLENLFRNAVEHGGPDVTVRIGALADRSGFHVEDDGRGIAAEDRTRVFEAGYSTNRDSTGFGLAIIREIADGHGWEITVTESDAGGARFEITGVEMGR